MATSPVADIYDAIKNADGEYCCICFCVSSERKLVLPVYISQLPRFNNVYGPGKNVIRICYLCEAMATKTVRFLRAIDLACNIDAALKYMTGQVRCALTIPDMHKSPSIRRALAKINQVENEMRCSGNTITQLSRSNILTVGSDVVDRPGTGLGATRPVGTGTSDVAQPVGPVSTNSGLTVTINTDTRSVDTRSPGTIPSVTSPSTNSAWPFVIRPINIEPVSYKEAKLEKVDPLLELEKSAVRVACEPGLMQLQVEEPITGNMLLHPIVMGKNGNMYVPTLKVQVVNNEFIKSVSDDELLQETSLSLPPPPARSNPKNKTRNRKEVKTFEEVYATCNTMLDNYVHFVNQNTNKAKVVLNHQKKKARLDCETDSSQDGRVGVTSQDGRVGVTSQEGRVGVDESGMEVASYAAAEAPTPVLRMDKVLDWEDKIPMEVISFMDATDPNPTERIMQPSIPQHSNVGVISDIRTIEDKEDSDSEFMIANPNKLKKYGRNDTVRPVNSVNAVKTINPVNFKPVNTYSYVESDNDVMLVENIECIDLC